MGVDWNLFRFPTSPWRLSGFAALRYKIFVPPFQGLGSLVRSRTQGGAALCPGLSCAALSGLFASNLLRTVQRVVGVGVQRLALRARARGFDSAPFDIVTFDIRISSLASRLSPTKNGTGGLFAGAVVGSKKSEPINTRGRV